MTNKKKFEKNPLFFYPLPRNDAKWSHGLICPNFGNIQKNYFFPLI